MLLLLLSHFSCVDSVRPHRWQPTRLPRPWDSPGKNTGVDGHFLLQCMKMKSESEVAQSCPTLGDPMDCSLPGSSVHGIFQARVLEWMPLVLPVIKRRVLKASAIIVNLYISLCRSISFYFKHLETPWDPLDCSPPGSSVHGILQARILEWVAISFSSLTRDWTNYHALEGLFLTTGPPGKSPFIYLIICLFSMDSNILLYTLDIIQYCYIFCVSDRFQFGHWEHLTLPFRVSRSISSCFC